MLCFTHAVTLTKIFKQHHAIWHARKMSFHAVGHAEIAASTLFSGLTHTKDAKKRERALRHLKDISKILDGLALTYGIARRMSLGLRAAMNTWHHREATGAIPSSNPIMLAPVPSGGPTDTVHLVDDIQESPSKRPRLAGEPLDESAIDVLIPLHQPLLGTMASSADSFSRDMFDPVALFSGLRSHVSPLNQKPDHQQFFGNDETAMLTVSLEEDWNMNPTWDTFVNRGMYDDGFSLGDNFDLGANFDSFRPTAPFTTSLLMPQERTLGGDRRFNIELF